MERNRETHAHKKKVINDMFITRDDHIASQQTFTGCAHYLCSGRRCCTIFTASAQQHASSSTWKGFLFFHAPFLVVHHWIRPSLVIAPTCAGVGLYLYSASSARSLFVSSVTIDGQTRWKIQETNPNCWATAHLQTKEEELKTLKDLHRHPGY
jgi:hypothetical protein